MAQTETDVHAQRHVRMYWWYAKDLEGFARAILDNLDGRVEFDPGTLLFHVRTDGVQAESHENGGFNYTHVCPPNCP